MGLESGQYGVVLFEDIHEDIYHSLGVGSQTVPGGANVSSNMGYGKEL